jgi:hypothetical protein
MKKLFWLESENPWFRIGIWLDVFANIYPSDSKISSSTEELILLEQKNYLL